MTKEEKYEKNLYEQWRNCKERQILDEYAGQPIEEVPEEHREKIARLRGFGLGVTVYEEIIEWLEGHNGEMPRGAIKVDGKTKKVAEQTEEENYEVNLRQRWNTCKERQILDEYAGRSIEEVPEEYREKIAKLRSLGQMGKRKDEKIKTRMKKSVAKEVESNEETREELEQLEMELQTTADFKGE